MKVITIGRDTDNDIVVDDSKVSRHHMQIVCDGDDFSIVDLYSSNGTFVNDRRISCETPLYTGDVVRIGNSTLPWQTYFAKGGVRTHDRRTNSPVTWIIGIASVTVIAVASYFTFFHGNQGESKEAQEVTETVPVKTVVKMHENNGVRYVPMKLNGQELNFVFDTGASSICISTMEAALLVKNGLLSRSDVIGNQGFVDATGGFSVGMQINLKSVEIGGREIRDVLAIIIDSPSAECLLGQTVLSRFGKYTIDNQTLEITFE